MEFFSAKGINSWESAPPPPKKVLSVAFFSTTVLRIAFLGSFSLLDRKVQRQAFGKEALAAQKQMTLWRSSEEAEALGHKRARERK